MSYILSMTKVLVFGIFDGVHPGHENFLRQAKKYGDTLVVAIGRASASRKIKCKTPKHSLRERIRQVQSVPDVTRAIAGDIKQGGYKVILREKPDIICLGYDQSELLKNLQIWIKVKALGIKIKVMNPYKPETHHTEIIRRRKA